MRPGHCFRLCTEEDYEDKLPATTGERAFSYVANWKQGRDTGCALLQLGVACRAEVRRCPPHLSSHLPAHTPPVPEMQRSDLAGTVLQLKSLGIDNIMSFEWLAPPPAEVSAAPIWISAARYPASMAERLSWAWVQRGACNCNTLCFTCRAHLAPLLPHRPWCARWRRCTRWAH